MASYSRGESRIVWAGYAAGVRCAMPGDVPAELSAGDAELWEAGRIAAIGDLMGIVFYGCVPMGPAYRNIYAGSPKAARFIKAHYASNYQARERMKMRNAIRKYRAAGGDVAVA